MAEITVNLIHEMKERHAHKKAKPPFITGLRTGYVRAWIFVVFKVWLVLALVNGVTMLDKLETNIGLLDSLVRNDFSTTEEFYDDQSYITLYVPRNNRNKHIIEDMASHQEVGIVAGESVAFAPRGPMVATDSAGIVAGDSTSLIKE